MKTVIRSCLALAAVLNIIRVCEPCKSVRAVRNSMWVPVGESVHMSCTVCHCGLAWSGGWVFKASQSTTFTPLSSSIRVPLSNYNSSVNSTVLMVHIQNINQSDAGAYKCEISWSEYLSSSGHVTYVNVTAPVESSGRNHRLLVCLGVVMGFSFVLGLLWYLTRGHPSTPPVPPHPRTSLSARVKPTNEVVYAEVALNEIRQQNPCPKHVMQPTIYSSMRFQ